MSRYRLSEEYDSFDQRARYSSPAAVEPTLPRLRSSSTASTSTTYSTSSASRPRLTQEESYQLFAAKARALLDEHRFVGTQIRSGKQATLIHRPQPSSTSSGTRYSLSSTRTAAESRPSAVHRSTSRSVATRAPVPSPEVSRTPSPLSVRQVPSSSSSSSDDESNDDYSNALHTSAPGAVISPDRFVEQIGLCNDRWSSGQQCDAQEFLRSLLDMLHAELNRSKRDVPFKVPSSKGTETRQALEAWQAARAHQSSVISDTFEGQLQSTLTCDTCGARSHSFEVFQDLSLPLPQTAAGNPSIQDCLQSFTAVEELSGEEAYACEKCKARQLTTKVLRVCRCPPLLVLHLKRFSMHASTLFSSPLEKDTTPVAISNALDLAPYCTAAASKGVVRPMYDLVGIVCHSGSLAGGHYTANVCTEGVWMSCNDSFTHSEMPALKGSRSAYLLLYALRN
ncbi:hypothetical protein WJX73_003725 [Symbiochloris irregularis]|uniref:ubiquitinyl hydrolase 1 n=1 Tax=Symbiochloris irregularis TaxID=706552 RepID=A0AAW1PUC8_9CHLO